MKGGNEELVKGLTQFEERAAEGYPLKMLDFLAMIHGIHGQDQLRIAIQSACEYVHETFNYKGAVQLARVCFRSAFYSKDDQKWTKLDNDKLISIIESEKVHMFVSVSEDGKKVRIWSEDVARRLLLSVCESEEMKESFDVLMKGADMFLSSEDDGNEGLRYIFVKRRLKYNQKFSVFVEALLRLGVTSYQIFEAAAKLIEKYKDLFGGDTKCTIARQAMLVLRSRILHYKEKNTKQARLVALEACGFNNGDLVSNTKLVCLNGTELAGVFAEHQKKLETVPWDVVHNVVTMLSVPEAGRNKPIESSLFVAAIKLADILLERPIEQTKDGNGDLEQKEDYSDPHQVVWDNLKKFNMNLGADAATKDRVSKAKATCKKILPDVENEDDSKFDHVSDIEREIEESLY